MLSLMSKQVNCSKLCDAIKPQANSRKMSFYDVFFSPSLISGVVTLKSGNVLRTYAELKVVKEDMQKLAKATKSYQTLPKESKM
jgi:hypothetical protein